MLQKYADPNYPQQVGQPMDSEELLGYLRASDKIDIAPLDAVLAQTEVIGDPALPSETDCAVLRWIGDAFELWEQSFPLESALTLQLRKLKPVLAIAAVTDANFYSPGAHPLHRILDTLQTAATGWQESLGRAGQPTLSLVEKTVDEALSLLEGNGDPKALAASTVQSAQRNQSRADRMAKRAAETELGRLKAARAKVIAAGMINQLLQKLPVTPEIGKFLRGPWYDSAQLVFLKFGEDSKQWKEMSETTSILLNSLQPPDQSHEGRRQQLFESVSGIPGDVRRWLLSIQHDNEVVEQIMSEIEYAHLRIMRNQPANLEHELPIKPEDSKKTKPGKSVNLEGVCTGQWFLIRSRKGDMLRVQITMIEPHQQQLLFCNLAGIKVQTLDFANFAKLLDKKTAEHLDCNASFSRSLIVAAGIESDEEMAILTGEKPPVPQTPPTPRPAPAPAPAQELELEPEPDVEHIAPEEPLQVEAMTPPAPQLPDSGLPELPMGTWLGFHDVDPPLLAKLALHDKVRRLLIFVNRKGVEQRRLEEEEYLTLIRDGLVDIMEANNNFREQVERARKRMQNHQKGGSGNDRR